MANRDIVNSKCRVVASYDRNPVQKTRTKILTTHGPFFHQGPLSNKNYTHKTRTSCKRTFMVYPSNKDEISIPLQLCANLLNCQLIPT